MPSCWDVAKVLSWLHLQCLWCLSSTQLSRPAALKAFAFEPYSVLGDGDFCGGAGSMQVAVLGCQVEQPNMTLLLSLPLLLFLEHFSSCGFVVFCCCCWADARTGVLMV